MTINKTTQYTTNPDTIPVSTASGDQSLSDALDDRWVVFPTVSDMSNATNLSVGDRIKTSGYLSSGDGGENDYEIVANSTGTDDGGTFINLTGSGLQAKGLFPGNSVSILQYGAVADGVVDDNAAIVAALSSHPNKLIEFPKGGIVVSKDSIVVPDGGQIQLNQSTLRFELDGAVKNLVMGNNTSCVNGEIENLGTNFAGAGQFQCPVGVGDYGAGAGRRNVILSDLRIKSNRPNGNGVFVTGDSSNVIIKNIDFGDSANIGRGILCHWGGADDETAGTTHPNNIVIENIRVGAFSHVAADSAVVFISASHNVTVNNVIAESIPRALVSVFAGDYGYYYAPNDIQRLALRGLSINNCHARFSSDQGFRVDLLTTMAPVNRAYETDLKFNQCSSTGTGLEGAGAGFSIAQCNGVRIVDCKVTSHLAGVFFSRAADNCRVIGGEFRLNWLEGVRMTDSTTPPENCKVMDAWCAGNNQSAGSAAGIGILDAVRCGAVRCELGTSSETDQAYGIRVSADAVDAEIIGNNVDGVASGGIAYSIGNSTTYGVISRFDNNTADSGITYQSGVNPVQVSYSGRGVPRRVLVGQTPTSGTWDKGDTVYYDPPLIGAGGKIGSVCVTAGTPGTWKPFGAIDA